MTETLDSSDALELEEADYSTDVDAVLLNALDKRARKIKLVPWVVHAPTYEIFLERKEKAIERSGVCKRTFEYWIEAYRGQHYQKARPSNGLSRASVVESNLSHLRARGVQNR